MQTILPFTDSSFVYNNETKRYTLTLDEVRNKLGVDLVQLVDSPYITDKNVAAQRILEQISSAIYYYIYSFNNDNLFQRYLLHCIPDARPMLKEAMLFQVEYIIRNGDINQYTWINSSHAHDIHDVRNDRAVSPYAIQALMKPLTKTGMHVLYSGNFMYPPTLVDNAESW